MKKLRIIGISSGMGVSLYPFRKHEILFNVEPRAIFHTPGNIQWKLNFGKIPLDKTMFREAQDVDVLISSPDCGSGSILRYSRAKELGNHKENKSLALFFASVEKYAPKFFLFENLEGLFKSFPEKDFNALLAGYKLIKHIAPVTHWGNSQKDRKRLVVVGIRKDVAHLSKYFKKLVKVYPKTCKELYGDLKAEDPSIAHIREPLEDIITIYSGKKMSLNDIRKEWIKNPGRRWNVTDRKFTTAPGVYRNRELDFPATARKANRQFDHKGLQLTPRQLARIQGVPDSFKLWVDDNKLKYCINKGRATVTKTPPMEISAWFLKRLTKALKNV